MVPRPDPAQTSSGGPSVSNKALRERALEISPSAYRLLQGGEGPDLLPTPAPRPRRHTLFPEPGLKSANGAFQKTEAMHRAGSAQPSSQLLWEVPGGKPATEPPRCPGARRRETYMRIWVFFRVKLSSSKASSISWVFWTSKRFCSSRFTKTSRSCWGSVKYSCSSCNQSHVELLDGAGPAPAAPAQSGH